MPSKSEHFNIVGKPVIRGDAALKAAGLAEYSADHRLPDLLAAKVLRSPHPHARIVSVDTSRARAVEGVAAVITAADFPETRTGRWLLDRTVLARHRVRHVGEAVAAVAAVDEETAGEALRLIDVEYQPLPGVFDPVEAMEPDSVRVHEEAARYFPPERNCRGNILHSQRITVGDVEAAFQKADLIYEASYATPIQHAGFTQPHQCVAGADPSGKLTLWTSTKDPFGIRRQLSQILGYPMSSVRIVAGMCGGDFGGKGSTTIEGICAALALKAGKPVKLTLDWHEELGSTFVRTRAMAQLKAGVKKDGTLLALKGRIIHDCGAYMDAVASNLSGDLANLQGPYRWAAVDVSALMVYTNNPPTGHVRGVRYPQACFAIESHIDSIARKVGMDPVEIRLRNIMRDGDRVCTGGVLRNVSAGQVLEATAAFIKRQKRPVEPNTGWGIAMAQYNIHPLPGGLQTTSAGVRINDDGTVQLLTGSTEQGSGIVTVLQQIVAEELGIPVDSVTVAPPDTDVSPWERGTGASETTYRVGPTVQMAARDARDQLLSLAARKLDCEPEKLVLAEGRILVRDAPGRSVPMKDAAREAISSSGGPILGTGLSQRKERFRRIEADKGIVDGPSYGAAIVKVAVDRETGKVTVLQCHSVWDAGFAINPANVEGQIEGGVACGLGYALTEEMVVKNGRTLNNNIVDYHVPASTDIPAIESKIIEVPSNWGPYGAKGLGEVTNAPVAPAVANAVFDAAGVRLTELPLTQERVFFGLETRGSRNSNHE
ncbi:MAG: molybdopterin-dependent oxidoreductase [Chloroflexi bacterium]|nr:molybdopterin-dependent oxidoreductase [Chloroflexota bacterium]